MMQHQLIDSNGGKPISYDSLLVKPAKLSIFGSDLCLKIVQELVKEPCCAMDLARRLEQHEQKIYYHLRRLEDAGIVKQVRAERRYSMTAKIYGVVAPVVATKLYDDGQKLVNNNIKPHVTGKMIKFFQPFVEEGRLNGLIITGDPYPHGKYNKPARAGIRAFDFLMLLGNVVHKLQFPHYLLDVDTQANDLKKNLIIMGSPKANTIAERVNSSLPVYFDLEGGWKIVSKNTGKRYDDARTGIIIKCDNPFAKDKKMLLIAGIRSRGMQAAIIALTQHFDKVINKMDEKGDLVRVVEGYDSTGNKVIDAVRFLE